MAVPTDAPGSGTLHRMSRIKTPTLLVAGAAALAVPAGALAASYDVPDALGPTLDRVDARTPLPVLVPSSIQLDFDGRLYASGGGSRNAYDIGLDGAKDCGGANACFLASFRAERGGTFAYRTRLKLRGGIPAAFKPLSCGGSCSPPAIQFRRSGVLYEIQAKVPGNARARLVAAANSALAAGPR